MKYLITEKDKRIINQNILQFKYRIYVENNLGQVIDVIEKMNISSFNVSSDSGIRRTLSVTLFCSKRISEYLNLYFPVNFVFQCGIFDFRENDYVWYDCGTYVMTDFSGEYDQSTNTISLSLSDWYSKLDGTRNGQNGGAPTITIEQFNANGEYVTLRNALVNLMQSEGYTKLIVEDLGEFYGIQSNNPDGYEEYRKNNPQWNALPYTLEFSAGDTFGDMVDEVIQLYPNQQAYFDIYNNFCANLIPSCINDPIELDNDFIQKILLGESSESSDFDVQLIKNVTEVWGKNYDVDRVAETSTVEGNVYKLNVDLYEEYVSGHKICFTPADTNVADMKLQIGNLDAIPIYNEFTTTPPIPGSIAKDVTCVVKLTKKDGNMIAYHLGEFQPHALCVLTDDANDKKYTIEYFKKKYNCKYVTLREEKGSPFTVQKIGEVLDVKTGDTFENILSNTIAMENAIYQNRISSSLNDTITINTKMIPWLDVMCKVSYKKAQESEPEQYLVSSISHNVDSSTSSITLTKFYPLYYFE